MAKISVLVVDDEPAILRFLKPALEANNYVLTSAGTVAEAVRRIAADTPDAAQSFARSPASPSETSIAAWT